MTLGYLTEAGHIFLTINCLWFLYHATRKIRRGDHARKVKDKIAHPAVRAQCRTWWEQWQVYFRLANGFLALVFMWLFMILFTVYREDVRVRAGPADEDSEWTFGQVLSLATWAPVAVELINAYVCTCEIPLSHLIGKR